MSKRAKAICGGWLLAALGVCPSAQALDFGTFGNWDSPARRDAANASMRAVVNRFNAYGDFNWGSDGYVDVFYNPGVPTAQAGYYGSIDFGGTWPNERVSQHELNHWLGSGTYWNWGNQFQGGVWTGPKVNALMAQFDGEGAVLRQSGVHFFPYGLNYDNEVPNAGTYMRNVALTYAMRQDMGNGNPNNPWSSTNVTLTGSDPVGTSAFNWFGGGQSGNYPGWNDRHFAHAGAAYSTGAFSMRTPEGFPSWTFAGNSLTVNPGGRLLYNGWGTTGVVTIRNFTVNGGTVRHDQFSQDLFQLAGRVTIASTATFEAANGPMRVLGPVGGSGSLVKTGSHTLTLAGGSDYTGSTTINAGTLRLSPANPVANYTFDNVSGGVVVNGGTGGSGMNGTLANGASIVPGGRFGNAVSLAGGASVNINNPITDLGHNGNWTVSAWVKTTTPGGSILTKGDGGWSGGNTIFYLGDGTAGGSGGVPGAVRFAGGFFQGSSSATRVNDGNWHQVAYVNSGGSYAIYVDGVPQPLSPGNAGFANADVGSIIRLGVSTNTVPADGSVNFNGLLDGVQFYNRPLSGSQVAALYQGLTPGVLPPTTAVTIASGATLDVNGTTQRIGSLSGPAGSSVVLGAGQLTVGSAANTQFAGTISGSGGSLVKVGTGTLTLTGNNTYTGPTTAAEGVLAFGASQRRSSLTVGAGATAAVTPGGGKVLVTGPLTIAGTSGAWAGKVDVADNALAVDWTPAAGSPIGVVADQVKGGHAGGAWTGNGITSSRADANTYAVGYGESGTLFGSGGGTFFGPSVDGSTVLLRRTLYGDANIDGSVNGSDFSLLAQNFGRAGVLWPEGDFNYDGSVNGTDFALLAGNFGKTAPGAGAALSGVSGADWMAVEAFGSDIGVPVPEPGPAAAALGLLACTVLQRRRRTASI